jgi:hypothetical protein
MTLQSRASFLSRDSLPSNGITVSMQHDFVRIAVWIQCTVLLAFLFGLPFVQASSQDSSVNFVVFSDTHVGKAAIFGSGSDNLTAVQRFRKLLNATNQINTEFVVNCGDITDGWNFDNAQSLYSDYIQIIANSTKRLLEIKGNHDCNTTLFQKMIGPLNWVERFDDVLAVGIGALSESGVEWMTNGTSYNQTTFSFLNQVVISASYNKTRYHFLFEHFAPYSTWGPKGCFHVPPNVPAYYHYFNIVFCGHEGGKERESMWLNQTPIIKSSHLGDERVSKDTFLTIRIDRTNDNITVASHNFYTGAVYTLFTQQGNTIPEFATATILAVSLPIIFWGTILSRRRMKNSSINKQRTL